MYITKQITSLSELFGSIYERRELLWMLVQRNLHIRYKSSALGFVWTLLNPVFLIVIYSVFLHLLGAFKPGGGYLPSFVIGIVVWQFLAMCMGDSLHSILGNASLVTKVSFPRAILPLSMVVSNLINFLLSFGVLVLFLVIYYSCSPGPGPEHGGALIPSFNFYGIWVLVPAFLSLFALCLGMSLMFSCANVFFRDTEHLLSLLMLAWFFLTPIFYDISILSTMASLSPATASLLERICFMNPMTGIVTATRYALMGADIIAPRLVTMSLLICWLILVFGIKAFQRVESRFADKL